jgi:endoglycosylceramidase
VDPKRVVSLFAVTLAVVSVLTAGAAAAQPRTSAPQAALTDAGPFGNAGRWITDAAGRVFVTSGINMVNKRAPYAPDATGFGDDDAAFLAANGFDSVRLGVIWKAIEPQPGVYDDAYLDRIKTTVDTLARHGVTSLLDMHQDMFNERFQGEFAPDWAVLDDGLPAWPQLGFPANQFLQLALMRAHDHFLENSPGPGGVGLQDRFAAMWGHVAQRFSGVPGVLGYDVFNEPWAGTQWLSCFLPGGCPGATAGLTAMHHKVAAAIRAEDPSTLVFYEPFSLSASGAPMSPDTAGVKNQAISFHDYCPIAYLTKSDSGCDLFDNAVMTNADNHSAATGSGRLLTEFGATNSPDVLSGVVDRAAAHMVGWQYWAYCGCNDPTTADQKEQGLVGDPAKPTTSDNVNAQKLALLSVPHPRAVAGTPLHYGFDRATSTFRLQFTTTRAAGNGVFPAGSITIVSAPQIQYPQGYRATVIGAHVTSAPNAPELQMAADAGADEINVTITPA